MSGQLPTLLLVGVFIGGGIVLLNPELRCNLLGLCGGGGGAGGMGNVSTTPPKDEPETPPPPADEEENDDDGNIINVYNVVNNPQPVILNPPPPIYYQTSRGPQIVRYAANKCCACKTHTDGIVRCRTGSRGPYTFSFRSAKYNVVESAKICARTKCGGGGGGWFGGLFGGGDRYDDHDRYDNDRDHDWDDRDDDGWPKPGPKPKPTPTRCPTQISKNGRRYTLTNLTRLPDVMTMQYPPTYIKEGNCIYKIMNTPTPAPAPAPTPPPPTPTPTTPPNPSGTQLECTNYLCKSYPWLCPHCPKTTTTASYAQSLFTTSRVAI